MRGFHARQLQDANHHPPYEGKIDLLEHVSAFNNHINQTSMTGHARYNCFPVILAKGTKK